MINVKGEYSTMGFVGHLKNPAAQETAVIAEMLEAAGAVFYCKTNVPQTLFVSTQVNGMESNPTPRDWRLIVARSARVITMFLDEP